MNVGYEQLVKAGADSLRAGEQWVIDHDEGPLLQTASSDFTVPVRIICEATGCDWDDLRASGFRLARRVIEA